VTREPLISSKTSPAACRKALASSRDAASRLGPPVAAAAGWLAWSRALAWFRARARTGARLEDEAGGGGVRVQGPVRPGDLAGRGDDAPPRADHVPGRHDVRRLDRERLDQVHLQLKGGVRLAAVEGAVHRAAHGRIEQGAEDAAVN
jgi:hypothetical protein